MALAYLSLGSNLGDRATNLRAALDRLNGPDTRVVTVSSFYETEPVGETPAPVPEYINCVAAIETGLSPLALLDYTQSIERDLGRVPTFRWGPRTIDIDLLLYDNVTMETERLVLPHPRMFERAFVMIPLREIAPLLILPNGRRLADEADREVISRQVIKLLSETASAKV